MSERLRRLLVSEGGYTLIELLQVTLILGVVLGAMLEDNFVSSMIKSDGNLLAFVSRPIAGALGLLTLLIWFLPLGRSLLAARRARSRGIAP